MKLPRPTREDQIRHSHRNHISALSYWDRESAPAAPGSLNEFPPHGTMPSSDVTTLDHLDHHLLTGIHPTLSISGWVRGREVQE